MSEGHASGPAPLGWMTAAAARRWGWVLLLGLIAIQVWLLSGVGNGIFPLANGHAEIDEVRAAEGYRHDGLWSHHGLPRLLYGHRYPGEGTVKDHVDERGQVPERFRIGFPSSSVDPNQWPYTHYPPGPFLILGLQAKLFGLDPLWHLRVLPIVFCLWAVAIFFRSLARHFGEERGFLLALACSAAPVFSMAMPGFFYEGYALALLLLQSTLLLEAFWNSRTPGPGIYVGLFALGFVQGWLSFDHAFVVSLLALPFWLFRRGAGSQPLRIVLWLTMATGGGFALAHLLHFWEVAAELGSAHAALAEFRSTATERAGLEESAGYLFALWKGVYMNVRLMFKPTLWYFGPFLLLGCGAAGYLALKRRLTAPAAVAAAFLICFLWTLAMPQHTMGNGFSTTRHYFVFYFFIWLALVSSLREKPHLAPSLSASP